MNTKPGQDRPRVSRSLPHSSWNLDRPLRLDARERTSAERRADQRRKVTPEEIWAVVDATN